MNRRNESDACKKRIARDSLGCSLLIEIRGAGAEWDRDALHFPRQLRASHVRGRANFSRWLVLYRCESLALFSICTSASCHWLMCGGMGKEIDFRTIPESRFFFLVFGKLITSNWFCIWAIAWHLRGADCIHSVIIFFFKATCSTYMSCGCIFWYFWSPPESDKC